MVVRSGYFDGEPCWADAESSDMDAAERFYGEVFGWTFIGTQREWGDYVLCLKNGQPVAALTPPMPDTDRSPVWTTYLKTSDAATAVERIEPAGGGLLMAGQ